MAETGRLVAVADTQLYVVERGDPGAFPLLVLHGGPGLDHHMFGDYLDPIAADGRYRLVLVDQRAQGGSDRSAPPETWTLERMAADVTDLAAALGVSDGYAVLGHSYGAFVVLQHAVDFPGAPRGTIVSAGVGSARWLALVEEQLARFEPVELREQVAASWERESTVATEEDAAQLLDDQLPFHFRLPTGPVIDDYRRRTAGQRFAPDVLRRFATEDYGGIEVVDRLPSVPHPMLVLAGRYDRVCPFEAGEEIAAQAKDGRLVAFESSAHMTFAEEPDRYLAAVREFLDRVSG
jgi:pimeloyl-ACP methyl ester carboxylesterase